jgi:predicted GIY-YIG superfamily endonuclease
MANHQTSFFICIYNYQTFEWNISCENGRTNEKLTVKRAKHIILISRHPSEAANKWIEENENEIKKWTSKEKDRLIALDHRNCEIAI